MYDYDISMLTKRLSPVLEALHVERPEDRANAIATVLVLAQAAGQGDAIAGINLTRQDERMRQTGGISLARAVWQMLSRRKGEEPMGLDSRLPFIGMGAVIEHRGYDRRVNAVLKEFAPYFHGRWGAMVLTPPARKRKR